MVLVLFKNKQRLDTKKGVTTSNTFNIVTIVNHYFLCRISDDTLNFLHPVALLLESTFLPYAEAILSVNPCLFFLVFLDG